MKQRGYSLIELIIVAAVIGILSAIALPGYFRYVKKTRNDDAKVCLAQILTKETEYFTEYKKYKESVGADIVGDLGAGCVKGDGVKDWYDFSATVDVTSGEVTITATPDSTKAANYNGYSLDSTGAKKTKYSGDSGYTDGWD